MKLAITGGIGEGKSTVAGYLREAGISVGSADAVAASIFDRADVQRWLAERLGLRAPVVRSDLRSRIFADPQLRREVNAFLHPRIRAAMTEAAESVWEVPLLIESCIQHDFHRIWVVTCGPDEQLRRLKERGLEASEAGRILASQLRTEVKMQFADRIIRTNCPFDTVRSYVIGAIASDLSNHLA